MTDLPRLEVDPSSSTPPFEQLRGQVVAHVEAGRLAPGDKLPPIRGLAADLGLAAGTVARAYRELEADGVVVTRRRAGTVVADSAVAVTTRVRRAADDLAAVAREAGLDDAAVVEMVRAALRSR
ncbi:GntR family transcriptional regulator [Luteimicrobium xylanilyticum]|uniref:HTH-type transcriptional repressor YtrA n=1 Tax=Luteimicrobium xylanilyticum TaxID=1133546 RepID=A0A5P9Q789_9MICO|nr:GntR family transcriptional regulator [Luteimicrobium xylanilyticum]QFU97294.1 HTH-type transcriptional repressor YtrA [Luteimicrobium xylanilyticum]